MHNRVETKALPSEYLALNSAAHTGLLLLQHTCVCVCVYTVLEIKAKARFPTKLHPQPTEYPKRPL